jgi:hypothetical protein
MPRITKSFATHPNQHWTDYVRLHEYRLKQTLYKLLTILSVDLHSHIDNDYFLFGILHSPL